MNADQHTTLHRLLQEAHDRRASDLFLLPGEPPAFRVDGALQRAESLPLLEEEVEAMAGGLAGPERIAAIGRDAPDVVTTCSIEGVVDGRVCIARSLGRLTMVIRLLPRKLPTPQQLHVPEVMLEVVNSPAGLVIISGPAGSGKTTTLLGLLEHLNLNAPVHIRTIEHPLTMRLVPKRAVIMQQEVGIDTPSTLAGIKTAMLQDLDVLMVGELRMADEVQACLTAAENGHLVIVQMHADDPGHAITRLADAMPTEIQPSFRRVLASQLRGVLTQRLIRGSKGGVVPAYAVLVPDDEAREAIRDGSSVMTRRSPWPAGCQTMRQDVEHLLAEGRVTAQTVDEVFGSLT